MSTNDRKGKSGKAERKSEPAELATWREIILHADRLERLAASEPREIRVASRIARRLTSDEAEQAELVAEAQAEAQAECKRARRDLRRLHASIERRPKPRARPPDDLAADLRAWLLLDARDELRRYLAGSAPDRSEAMLTVIARTYPGAPPERSLDEIERLARELRADGSGTREALAQRMTALAAGLPLNATVLKRRRKPE